MIILQESQTVKYDAPVYVHLYESADDDITDCNTHNKNAENFGVF